jgi:hypothetical protein
VEFAHPPDPARVARAHEKHRRAFEEAALPLYGLGPEWHGIRAIGGYEFWTSDGTPGHGEGREYGMIHGDGHPELRPGRPFIRVVTSTTDVLQHPLPGVLRSRLEPPAAGPGTICGATSEEHPDGRPAGAPGNPVTIPVDGDPVVFETVTRGAAWVARRGFTEYAITVEARHFDPAQVTVVRVTDLEPYIRGGREWRELMQQEIRRRRGEL